MVVTFLVAVVSIRGDTWNKDAKGWARLTLTGRILAAFAGFSLLVSVVQTVNAETTAAEERTAAEVKVEEMRAALIRSDRALAVVQASMRGLEYVHFSTFDYIKADWDDGTPTLRKNGAIVPAGSMLMFSPVACDVEVSWEGKRGPGDTGFAFGGTVPANKQGRIVLNGEDGKPVRFLAVLRCAEGQKRFGGFSDIRVVGGPPIKWKADDLPTVEWTAGRKDY